jgi:tRNA dimethylallyltransferase
MNRIPIIIGPTAVGKTDFAIKLAKQNRREIISADSMQVYKEMSIGTAKLPESEMMGISHHLMDMIAPDEEWSLSLFLTACRQLLAKDSSRYMIAGGTGLYIRALIFNFSPPPIKANQARRDNYKRIAKNNGVAALFDQLKQVDPKSAEIIKPNDEFRIVRALEVFDELGKPLSEVQMKDESYAKRFKLIALNRPRDIVYERINRRVDKMFANGLVDEVQGLIDKGYSKDLPSLQALGYKEVIAYLDGTMDLESTKEFIKKKTRNFAKRQLTWYRSFPDVEWVDLD